LKKAVARFSKSIRRASELIEKDGNGFQLWQTPYGSYWIVGDSIGGTCWLLAEQKADIYRADSPLGIREGDIVLDCGAHYGVFVRKALDLGAAVVVAIEVAPENAECLRRTFSAEIAQGRVIVHPKGVWDRDGEFILKRSVKSWGHRVIEGEDEEGLRVPLTTIDAIVAELELPRVDFIKMDIEGAERRAILGAAETLAEFRPRMAVAAYHREDDLDALPAAALAPQPDYEICLSGVGAGKGNLTLSFR
jgi:FkbM family methyltransferase